MKTISHKKWHAVALLAFSLSAVPASAKVVRLQAEAYPKTLPGGVTVTMWGYKDLDVAGSTPTSPGPVITVTDSDPDLDIVLTNNLPGTEATSIVIAGQQMPQGGAPTYFGVAPNRRMKSFTSEVAKGSTATYQFRGLRPGTYLYQSGTHIAKQVQMGLFGAMKKDFSGNQTQKFAYPGVEYSTDVVLVYSEIDKALHDAVAANQYGAGAAVTSTIDYKPTYFLVNGQPFSGAKPAVAAPWDGMANKNILLRFVSAALRSHVPALQSGYMRIVAEDGSQYPYAKEQYSTLLAPMKTIDAVITPAASGLLAIYDRSLHLQTSPVAASGGMLTYLKIQTDPNAKVAVNDAYSGTEDTNLTVADGAGVLANDTGAASVPGAQVLLVRPPFRGSLQGPTAGGGFTYIPNPNSFGADSFTYRFASPDGSITSNIATVTLNMAGVNDAPVAVADVAQTNVGRPVKIFVVANDTDADGDVLTPVITAGSVIGGSAVAGADRAVTFTPTVAGQGSFRYRARDAAAVLSNEVTVTVTIAPNAPPVAVDDWAKTNMNVPVSISVLANDTDDANPAQFNFGSLTITNPPTMGGIVQIVPGAGGAAPTIRFTPKLTFIGTDVFSYTIRDNGGLVSNTGVVRVNVVR